MVLFSSDNGPVVDDGYREDAEEKLGSHKPAGPFRGGKYSNFEAGTRVPLLVRWPAAIKAGGESSALLAHVDFPASFAKITGQELPANAAPDSFDVADALMGRTTVGRDHLVEHAGVTSLRQGQWKFIPAGNGPKLNRLTNTEMGNDKMPQLYDLAADPGETKNLAVKEPQRLAEMRKKLESIKTGGSSRPGFKP
jgi:arylsulfatase A-like enzyme